MTGISPQANIATGLTGLPRSCPAMWMMLLTVGQRRHRWRPHGGRIHPGILGLACMLRSITLPGKGYRSAKKYEKSERVKVFFQAIPCLMMIVTVIGVIISGIHGHRGQRVVAVVYSLILSPVFTSPSNFPSCPAF